MPETPPKLVVESPHSVLECVCVSLPFSMSSSATHVFLQTNAACVGNPNLTMFANLVDIYLGIIRWRLFFVILGMNSQTVSSHTRPNDNPPSFA